METEAEQIDWGKASIEDYKLAKQIVLRAEKELAEYGGIKDKMSVQMDIVATHISGCKLKMQELLEAKTFDFLHDVCGIMQHIDRTTGKLQNCFLPRYANLKS